MLTDSQKQQVAAWVGEGLSLAQIQTKIGDELGVAMTYMDVRFLIDDLNLELRDAPVPEKKSPSAAAADSAENVPAGTPEGAERQDVPAASSGVSLSVDAVQMPGVFASGEVVFSDGVRGKWFIDERGPGLSDFPEGYRPPKSDALEFQQKLVAELRKRGLA